MAQVEPDLRLAAGDLSVTVTPSRGGGILSFDKGDFGIFKSRSADPSPIGLASFPLLPFSNRIANGRFVANGRTIALPRNHPADADHPHALHGLGWQLPWEVKVATSTSCHLRLDVPAGVWPWSWRGEQVLTLDRNGLTHAVALTNLDQSPMPSGIGLHPWLPRNARTVFQSQHLGEWQTAADGLPISLDSHPQPRDWWQGRPVETRIIDTVYTGRSGSMSVAWPDRGLTLDITPTDSLGFTVIYVPDGTDRFCVEPVSHMTDAVNRDEPPSLTGLRWLAEGETLKGSVRYDVRAG